MYAKNMRASAMRDDGIARLILRAKRAVREKNVPAKRTDFLKFVSQYNVSI